MILIILLDILLYYQTFLRLPETIKYFFTQIRNSPITYFNIICKYYQTRKDGGVLGYHIQDSQREIILS